MLVFNETGLLLVKTEVPIDVPEGLARAKAIAEADAKVIPSPFAQTGTPEELPHDDGVGRRQGPFRWQCRRGLQRAEQRTAGERQRQHEQQQQHYTAIWTCFWMLPSLILLNLLPRMSLSLHLPDRRSLKQIYAVKKKLVNMSLMVLLMELDRKSTRLNSSHT